MNPETAGVPFKAKDQASLGNEPRNASMDVRTSGTGPVDLVPLGDFYRSAGRRPLNVQILPPLAVPVPQRDLLVHDSDMTSTLENFHGGSLGLKVLSRRLEHSVLYREVLLVLDGTNKPVEYGAIRIYLDTLASPWREQVLAGERPLGAILNASGMRYGSQPTAFFEVPADAFLADVLQIQSRFADKKVQESLKPSADGVGRPLYGRRNTLTTEDGAVIAEIVEILPPTDAAHLNG